MISVGIHAKAYYFSIDMSSTCQSMFQLFHNYYAGTFTHNKTVAFFIERTGGLFRMFVVGGKSFHVTEACYSNRRNSSFCAACDHNIGIAILNSAQSVADTVSAGSTSCDDSGIRAFKA